MKSTKVIPALAVAVSIFMLNSVPSMAGKILAYTAYEEDEAKAFLEIAKKDLPDIDIEILRLSTGELAARLIAESANPKHDVIWGLAVTSTNNPKIYDTLESYSPKGIKQLDKKFIDKDNRWFATTGYMVAFCVNNERLAKKSLAMPTSWEDLTKPEYKGEVVMPNPASSGAGYIQVDSLLQLKGEKKGWKFLEKLDKNIAQYIKSGSKPCHVASAGEYTIGASFALRAIKNIENGSPITMVLPKEGSGNELEVSGLVKTAKNKEDAKRFLDWTLSKNAVNEYFEWKTIVTISGGSYPERFKKAGLPANISDALFDVDYTAAAKERTRIIEQWQESFER